MLRSTLCWMALIALYGCASRPELPPADAQDEKLTPERAKVALLEMMRSKEGKELGWFGGDAPDEMAKMPIAEEADGWFTWTAAFRFNPSRETYTFVVRPKPGSRACMFEYEGTFAKTDGKWAAAKPKLVRTVLESGE